MQKFIERMKIERSDLMGKIKKAKAAIENPPFGSDKESIDMLTEQVKAMEQYFYWLEERIKKETKKYE